MTTTTTTAATADQVARLLALGASQSYIDRLSSKGLLTAERADREIAAHARMEGLPADATLDQIHAAAEQAAAVVASQRADLDARIKASGVTTSQPLDRCGHREANGVDMCPVCFHSPA